MENPKSPGRWLRVLLIVSLALNLAVVGLVAGWAIGGPRGGPSRGLEMAIGPMTRALDREDRRWIMRELAGRDLFRPPAPDLRQEEEAAIRAAVIADPFDPAELDRILDGMRRHGSELQEAMQEALIARIAALSPEARAAFAQRLGVAYSERNHGQHREGPPEGAE